MFNYYLDQDRDDHQATVQMFEAIGRGEFEGYTSEYVILELLNAPEPKQAGMLALIDKYNLNTLKTDDKIYNLALLYIKNNVLTINNIFDALHIACATVNNLNAIISFNFRHINKYKTKIMTESINIAEGYKNILICTPMELFDHEK
jgi:predicted nucleic acid-binding protein